MTNAPRTVAVVGTGVIGASWAACFLAHGLDVVATDPSPDAEQRLVEAVGAHWPALERLGVVDGASRERLSFTDDLAAAVACADFVQESGPERPEVKRELLGQVDAAAPALTIIASSSSGFTPTELQAALAHHPARFLIGHPFSPPHLIPLVEVVGGERTDEPVVERAMDFYRSVGKRPVRLRRELPGHVVNRLQAALWREAYFLVQQGAISVGDLDAAVADGPGLRWALLGPLATQHLAGGPGGLAHVLEHLGPPMEEWWRTLGTPDLTPALREALVAGVDDELRGADQAALIAERDNLLVDLLAAKAAAVHVP